MKTIVVIPHYILNEEIKQLAINTIKSFRDNSDAVIVSVNDGSPMDCSFLKDISDVYIERWENGGFAETCNDGFRWILEHEQECYVVCANNDIEINKKTIQALKEPFDLFDNVAITGIISTKERDWEGKPLEEMNWGKISEGGMCKDRIQDGGLWMSKKSVLEKIGLFDEQFKRGGWEDIDIFLRARDTFGMRIVMNGRACYWHKQGATRWSDTIRNSSKGIENENLAKFRIKWGFDPNSRNVWKERELLNK